MKFWATLTSVFLVDQMSKTWISGRMALGESQPIVRGFLNLTYIRNQGASFGVLQGHTWLFLILAAIIIMALVYYQLMYPSESWLQFTLGLIVGGTIGNMVDRFRFGAVQDFIDLGWWPVFNFADTAIVTGGAVLILYLISHEMGQERD